MWGKYVPIVTRNSFFEIPVIVSCAAIFTLLWCTPLAPMAAGGPSVSRCAFISSPLWRDQAVRWRAYERYDALRTETNGFEEPIYSHIPFEIAAVKRVVAVELGHFESALARVKNIRTEIARRVFNNCILPDPLSDEYEQKGLRLHYLTEMASLLYTIVHFEQEQHPKIQIPITSDVKYEPNKGQNLGEFHLGYCSREKCIASRESARSSAHRPSDDKMNPCVQNALKRKAMYPSFRDCYRDHLRNTSQCIDTDFVLWRHARRPNPIPSMRELDAEERDDYFADVALEVQQDIIGDYIDSDSVSMALVLGRIEPLVRASMDFMHDAQNVKIVRELQMDVMGGEDYSETGYEDQTLSELGASLVAECAVVAKYSLVIAAVVSYLFDPALEIYIGCVDESEKVHRLSELAALSSSLLGVSSALRKELHAIVNLYNLRSYWVAAYPQFSDVLQGILVKPVSPSYEDGDKKGSMCNICKIFHSPKGYKSSMALYGVLSNFMQHIEAFVVYLNNNFQISSVVRAEAVAGSTSILIPRGLPANLAEIAEAERLTLEQQAAHYVPQ